ncbi:sigma-70 family RNA polymerase sigma factor [uncultured Croceitalea sp.]|uniref:RNA polymerase sigma factor n=1 Tax=uncultured Croceitalea sp. TaxID=1798908 RepID=UPI0033061831
MSKEEAFINAIKKNEGIIYKITSVYSNSKDEQKDLYQEIVYQLWKSFDSFKGKSKFSTWMYRVALNTSIAHINKGKKRINPVSMDFQLLTIPDENDTLTAERLSILYAHIKLLNAVEKGLILLFLEGKSYEEIATITGFSKTNVGTRLGRIKNKLRFQINK